MSGKPAEIQTAEKQCNNAGCIFDPRAHHASRNWFFAAFFLIFVAIGVVFMFKDRMLYGGNMPKYIASISLYKSLLCRQSTAELMLRLQDIVGMTTDDGRLHLETAITDQRPLWFLLMALISLHNDIPVVENLVLNLVLLAISVQLLLWVWVENKNPFLWIVGILTLSPFVLYQCWVWEPHILQLFLISVGLFLYMKNHIIPGFCLLVFSIGAHPGSLPFAACAGIHLLATKSRKEWIYGLIGTILGFGMIEAFFAILFWIDKDHLIPHIYFIETFIASGGRAGGGFAKAPGLLHFVRVIIMYFPFALLGFLSIRRWEHALFLLGPLLLFLLVGKGCMPGAHRVLLYIYVMAGLLFVGSIGVTGQQWLPPWCGAAICGVAMVIMGGYCMTVLLGETIRHEGAVNIELDPVVGADSIAAPLYYWNFRRFGPVQADARTSYRVLHRKIDDIGPPVAPHPYPVYHYWFACIKSLWLDKVEMRLAGSAASLDVRLRKSAVAVDKE